jgi:excisionase family DNA binding protein
MGDNFDQNAKEPEHLLKKPEVAAFFGTTVRTVENWMRSGEIPFFRIGRSIRFKKDDILQHLNTHKRVN